jgi:hypothetical protein
VAAADDDDIKTFRVIHVAAPGWRGRTERGGDYTAGFRGRKLFDDFLISSNQEVFRNVIEFKNLCMDEYM